MWGRKAVHWFSVTGLFEDFGGHVAWCTAGGGEDVELLFVHDARQTKVGDKEISIVFGRSEEEIFGFEITVDDAMVV
jgi:hypothetical protein